MKFVRANSPYSAFKHIASSVGVGAIELIENGRPAYRTVYVAKHKQMVYVLHTSTKTTNGVDRKAMATARQRYKIMVADTTKIIYQHLYVGWKGIIYRYRYMRRKNDFD